MKGNEIKKVSLKIVLCDKKCKIVHYNEKGIERDLRGWNYDAKKKIKIVVRRLIGISLNLVHYIELLASLVNADFLPRNL